MTITCDRCRDVMIEMLYKEADEEIRQQFSAHLASCKDCSEKYNEMTAVLRTMDQRTRPEPGDEYWNTYWDRLNEKLEMKPQPKLALFRPVVPSWAYGIAAILLVAVGIYLGRTYFYPQDVRQLQHETQTAAAPGTASEDSTTTEALAYLERTRNLLVGLANINEQEHPSFDLSRQQEASRRLIQQASILKVALNKPDQQLMRQLILDLEVILLQLANVEVKPGVRAVELVRKGIDQKSILLKINLEGMRAMVRQSSSQSKKNKTNS